MLLLCCFHIDLPLRFILTVRLPLVYHTIVTNSRITLLIFFFNTFQILLFRTIKKTDRFLISICLCIIIQLSESSNPITKGKNQKYTQEFKQTIVDLYHSGKTYNQIKEEYGISHNALANWIKQYSEVKIDDNTVLTAKQIKELQKRNAQLEEENLILKNPLRYSRHTQTKTKSC